MEKAREELKKALQAGPGAGRLALPGRLGARREGGRLGVMVARPSDAMADQLDLPKGQGVVVEEVQDGSAAAKVGLKVHDIVLELDGKAAPSEPAEFARQVSEVKADTAVDVVVLRKGRKETLKGLKLPEVKPDLGPKLDFKFPDVPFAVPGAPGAANVTTTINRNNDEFTARRTEGDLTLTVTGRVADGKASVSEVKVEDGKETHTYAELEKVPEAYRARAKALADQAAGKPAVRGREF
jgi:serine protease Do